MMALDNALRAFAAALAESLDAGADGAAAARIRAAARGYRTAAAARDMAMAPDWRNRQMGALRSELYESAITTAALMMLDSGGADIARRFADAIEDEGAGALDILGWRRAQADRIRAAIPDREAAAAARRDEMDGAGVGADV